MFCLKILKNGGDPAIRSLPVCDVQELGSCNGLKSLN